MLKILKFQCFSFGKKKKRMLKKGVANVAIFLVPFYMTWKEWWWREGSCRRSQPICLVVTCSLSLSLSNYRFHGIINHHSYFSFHCFSKVHIIFSLAITFFHRNNNRTITLQFRIQLFRALAMTLYRLLYNRKNITF